MVKLLNSIKSTFIENFTRLTDRKKPDFEFIENYKNEKNKQIIVARIINSFGKSFKFSATDLVSKRTDILEKFSIKDIVNIVGIAAAEKDPIVIETKTTSYKYFAILAMLFGAALITSNIASSKLTNFFGFTMTGGTLPYLCTYILGDILTEVYGYKRNRQLIWGAIFCNLFAIGFIFLAIRLPSSTIWHYQSEYELILSSTVRIVISSLFSYWCSEFLNSYILARLKIMFNGKYLVIRILLSSMVSITIDTALFISLAYTGNLSFYDILNLFILSYVFSIIWEISAIPFAIPLIKYLKNKETLDIFDVNTNFSPFSLDVSYSEKNNHMLRNKSYR